MAKRLILVRHASIEANHQNLFIGSSDHPLDKEGMTQARALAVRLEKRSINRIYVSPMKRCLQTAGEVTRACGIPAEINHDLREINFGEWENRSFSDIQHADPEAVMSWATQFSDFQFPGGESISYFHKRIADVAMTLASERAETVLAITHGGVILTMICRLLKIPPEAYLAFSVKPAGIVACDIHEDAGVLVELDNSISLAGK